MSNILEHHLEQNIEPILSRESYIDQAIQIFQDMKPEDITMQLEYRNAKETKYCLAGLFAHMTGARRDEHLGHYTAKKLGKGTDFQLSMMHDDYILGRTTFEQMRQKVIEYVESLKVVKT